MQETHIYVAGTVQGVGFRVIVKRHAMLHNIKGFVRNLPDGRVEICAQGKGDQINQFIKTIQLRPGLAVISGIESQYKPITKIHLSFEIH